MLYAQQLRAYDSHGAARTHYYIVPLLTHTPVFAVVMIADV